MIVWVILGALMLDVAIVCTWEVWRDRVKDYTQEYYDDYPPSQYLDRDMQ